MGRKKTTKKTRTKKSLSTGTLLVWYRDPLKPGSLGGLTRFAQANGITIRWAREVLKRDLGYTLHKPRRRRFPMLAVMVFGMDEQWMADLFEVINIAKYNRGYRYLLTVVDVFSKYAWVEPVKNKTGKAVTDAMAKILKRSEGRKPINLQTGDGKEFYKTFQALMTQLGVHHFSTSGDTKASVVERFNRTLKQMLYRYFTVKNTLNFVPILQKVTVDDDDLFRIDKIVKRKGDKVLVRWKGWPVKYDTWLQKSAVLQKPSKS